MSRVYSTHKIFADEEKCLLDTYNTNVSTIEEPAFHIFHQDMNAILGESSRIELQLQEDEPVFHEACVYHATSDSVFVTSNQFVRAGEEDKIIVISRLFREGRRWTRQELSPASTSIPMGNGGVNYPPNDNILFCGQGTKSVPSGLYLLPVRGDEVGASRPLINHTHGRQFNSPNDLVIHPRDNSIWFTDPTYGFEQGFRPSPELPCQVYRYDPHTYDLRVVADGLGRPNGICFNPGATVCYITDTDMIHGDGTVDSTRPATIYAYDMVEHAGSTFLANRRLFAHAPSGFPDGIKCDTRGNVYSGCGDGVTVWNEGGSLLGKIAIPGGVANFCFGRPGELLLMGEREFWTVTISGEVQGELLKAMGYEF